MMKLLTLLLKGVHQLLFLQEQIMADIATLTEKITNLTNAVQALEQKEQNKPETVLKSDLDPIAAQIDDATAKIQAVTNAG